MDSIRAALSGNTTGRQLLLNLKGAGDFLTWGQIYKPFTHTDGGRHTASCLSSALRSLALGPRRIWGQAVPAPRCTAGSESQDEAGQRVPSPPSCSQQLSREHFAEGSCCRGRGPSSLLFFPLGFLQLPVPRTATEPGHCSSLRPWMEAEPSQTLHLSGKPRGEKP